MSNTYSLGGRARQVLLIERDAMVRTVVAEFLEEEGFEVLQCDQTPESVLVGTLQPDIIILDLPTKAEVRDLQCVKELRKHPPTAHIPIVAMCRLRPSPDVPSWIKENGIAAFLLKPFDLVILLETVEKVLNKRTSGAPDFDADHRADTLPEQGVGARE